MATTSAQPPWLTELAPSLNLEHHGNAGLPFTLAEAMREVLAAEVEIQAAGRLVLVS